MVGFSARTLLALLLPLAAAGQGTNLLVMCGDASECQAGEACVAGLCTPLSDSGVRRLFPIAIDRIVDLDAGRRTGAVPDEVDARLRGLLGVAGFFDVLPASLNPPGASLESMRPTTIDYQAWHQSGAWAFVKGTVETGKDGKRLLTLRLFVAEEAGSRVLPSDQQVIASDDPREVKRAVARWVDDLVIAFTGKGGVFATRIAFAHRLAPGGPKEIRVMDVDGSHEQAVTSNGSINMLPGWTRSGQVAYTSFQEHNPDLWVEGKKLSGYPRMNTGAAFHRDGKRMAITLSKDGNAEIYVSDARTGKALRRVTRHRAIDTSPTWSPEGERLVFLSDRGTGLPQLYLKDLRTADPPSRIPQIGSYNSSPDWAPHSEEIAYSSMFGNDRYQIYATNLATGVIRRLTSQGSNEEPSWSPDGRYIVYTSTRGGTQALWVMAADGTWHRRLSNGDGIYMTPAWER